MIESPTLNSLSVISIEFRGKSGVLQVTTRCWTVVVVNGATVVITGPATAKNKIINNTNDFLT